MKTKLILWTSALALITALPQAHAEESFGDGSGEVRVPLKVYKELMKAAQHGTGAKAGAPARYAMGEAKMNVQVDKNSAEVQVELTVKVLEDAWTLVPLLPSGVALTQATENGRATQLVATPEGFAWSGNKKGSYKLALRYQVDIKRAHQGELLPVPVPQATSTQMTATVPSANLDLAVIPSTGLKRTSSGNSTVLSATLPSTNAVQISWRTPSQRGFAMSRATYQGALVEQAVQWRATLDTELFSASGRIPLLPQSVTLSGLKVDGKPSTVLVENGRFTAILKGRGRHKIEVLFETTVSRQSGPPRTTMDLPQVPISRFDLRLPGKKEVVCQPAANVRTRFDRDGTVATINAPMTARLTMTWSEAVPEEVREELRANASLYHSFYAEEGVLHGRAQADIEITRGETNIITFASPAGVQINKITAADGSISDWRRKQNEVSVFLNRKVRGTYRFDVLYERLTDTGPGATDILQVPLLSMLKVHRQRGMIALLTTSDFSLKPREQRGVSKVGENQIPAFVRQKIEQTVAHTYKFVDAKEAELTVQAVPPERKNAKFDAQIDTLISLSDVTMKGSVTVRINVKSGKMDVLRLHLPSDVTLLNLTAPSKRSHTIKSEGGAQLIDLHFTQEMEGEFPVDLDYERIISAEDTETEVPTVAIPSAEPEQGRIAVEALTAVEVQAAKTAPSLSSIDVSELPQQLLLKTRNPIRLAYKYVEAEGGHALALKVTRHKELETQVATIEKAHYRTLFTRDGLAVTTATFVVKNSRKQFLKVCLPGDSEVWSVFVDGKAEKPALATKSQESGPKCDDLNVLIKVINSAQGFPVELVYRSKTAPIGALGSVNAALPRPDMVVTNTRWDLFLPDRLNYRTPDTNMEVLLQARQVPRSTMANELASSKGSKQDTSQLRVAVPMSGVQFSFEKLYANQSDEPASVSIPYASGGGEGVASSLSALGALLFWLGVFFVIWRNERVPLQAAGGVIGLGVVIVLVTTYYLGGAFSTALGWSVFCAVVLAGVWAWRRFGKKFRKPEEIESASDSSDS